LTQSPSPRTARELPALLSLCIVLWVIAALSVGLGAWLLLRGAGLDGLVAIALAAFLAAAGLGLYRLRRWGVVLFALVGLLGAVRFLAGIMERFSNLSGSSLPEAIGALLSIIAAILLPAVWIYLAITFWRWTK
jgi:hypothetical protein